MNMAIDLDSIDLQTVIAAMTVVFLERKQMLENLTATQTRCSELIQRSRDLEKLLARAFHALSMDHQGVLIQEIHDSVDKAILNAAHPSRV